MALSLCADRLLGRASEWGMVETATLLTGLAIILSGLFGNEVLQRTSTNVSLLVFTIFIVAGAAEGFFRVIDYDFNYQERAYFRTPPFYRQPIEPTGVAFFKRSGPEEWTGQVLTTQLRYYNVSPNPYTDEPVITVRYDSAGFRNPDDLTDWEVAVVGDSFTELGYLPYDQLFTTILGRILDKRVRNLGVSQTGPLTHLSYLRDYGVAASTEHAVIVFFEGNDFWDIIDEFADTMSQERTGQRKYRSFERQKSMLRAFDQLLHVPQTRSIDADSSIQAYFRSATGEIPITLVYTPPTASEALADRRMVDALHEFFRSYSDFGEENNLTLWLALMPAKIRIVHGHVRFADKAADRFRQWKPSDLPQVLSDISSSYGVRFVDLTPSLMRETVRSRTLLYNTIYDTHLNALGSSVVAHELARHILSCDSTSRAEGELR